VFKKLSRVAVKVTNARAVSESFQSWSLMMELLDRTWSSDTAINPSPAGQARSGHGKPPALGLHAPSKVETPESVLSEEQTDN
jgi:hypothetical protein